MERKLFRGLPDSFLIGSIPFIYLFFYLFYINLRGTVLNIFEFYSLSLLPLLFLLGARGKELFDILGFDLNRAPFHIRIGRLLIFAMVGVLFGFAVYKLASIIFPLGLGMIFPFDVFYLQLTVASPLILAVIDTSIIAFFEEVIRIVPTLSYGNAFFKRGFKEGDSIIYGVFLSSFLFIVCHFFAWGGLDLMSLIIMGGIAIFMTLIGWLLYHKEIWGPLTFKEFSIISPILAHFTYDLAIALSLRVLPLGYFILGILG